MREKSITFLRPSYCDNFQADLFSANNITLFPFMAEEKLHGVYKKK